MPAVPAATGQIYLSSFYGKLAGQVTINTWAHLLEINSGSHTVTDIYNAMNTTWAGNIVSGGMVEAYCEAAAEDFTLDQYRVQCIHPTRYVAAAFAKGQSGILTGEARTANVSATIFRRGDFGSRRDQSSLHFPAMPSVRYENGEIGGTYISGELEQIRLKTLATVNLLGGAVTVKPVIYHKNWQFAYSLITFGVVQPQVRVMRRRTVGLGI